MSHLYVRYSTRHSNGGTQIHCTRIIRSGPIIAEVTEEFDELRAADPNGEGGSRILFNLALLVIHQLRFSNSKCNTTTTTKAWITAALLGRLSSNRQNTRKKAPTAACISSSSINNNYLNSNNWLFISIYNTASNRILNNDRNNNKWMLKQQQQQQQPQQTQIGNSEFSYRAASGDYCLLTTSPTIQLRHRSQISEGMMLNEAEMADTAGLNAFLDENGAEARFNSICSKRSMDWRPSTTGDGTNGHSSFGDDEKCQFDGQHAHLDFPFAMENGNGTAN
uniref:Uncharacterized protein n=1 Tax=Globodera pallida TaxID=36090 RepID=A0A183CGI5_GLOPA